MRLGRVIRYIGPRGDGGKATLLLGLDTRRFRKTGSPDLGILKLGFIGQILLHPGSGQVVSVAGLLAGVSEAYRNELALLGLGQPVGAEAGLGLEHAQHSLPGVVAASGDAVLDIPS